MASFDPETIGGSPDQQEPWAEFVRSIENGRPDPVYIEQQEAAQDIFVTWFSSQSHLTVGRLAAILHKCHARATEKSYHGVNPLGLPWVSTSEYVGGSPSQFRTYLANPVLFYRRTIGSKWLDMILNEREPSHKVEDADLHSWRPEIPSLPFLARPIVQHTLAISKPLQEERMMYIPMEPNWFGFYLEAMVGSLRQLAKFKNHPLRDKHSQIQWFKLLARYYQIAIAMHPYDSVNNSLFMGHVNGLLKSKGFKPITHGYWDFVASTVGTSRFEVAFATQIELANR